MIHDRIVDVTIATGAPATRPRIVIGATTTIANANAVKRRFAVKRLLGGPAFMTTAAITTAAITTAAITMAAITMAATVTTVLTETTTATGTMVVDTIKPRQT